MACLVAKFLRKGHIILLLKDAVGPQKRMKGPLLINSKQEGPKFFLKKKSKGPFYKKMYVY
jgi:hypothetical protein